MKPHHRLKTLKRREAAALGRDRYWTGKPCKHGHHSLRDTQSGKCLGCDPPKTEWKTGRTPEERRAYFSQRNKAAYARDPATKLARSRAWQNANRPAMNARAARRRAQKLNATLPGFDDEIRVIYENCPAGMQVDHEVPLISPHVCGLHVPWNLQYLETVENLRKSNRFTPG